MSKLTEELRTIGVFNEHGFFGDGQDRVWIGYTAGTTGRGGRVPVWQVYRIAHGYSVPTDQNGYWGDYGKKTFSVWGRGQRAVKLEEAKAWASAEFGITEWKRTPFGGWGEAAFVDARLKALKKKLREAQETVA